LKIYYSDNNKCPNIVLKYTLKNNNKFEKPQISRNFCVEINLILKAFLYMMGKDGDLGASIFSREKEEILNGIEVNVVISENVVNEENVARKVNVDFKVFLDQKVLWEREVFLVYKVFGDFKVFLDQKVH
jgi:hypothetical protein